MIINSITIYKTPLSSNYLNVFDFELTRRKFQTLREEYNEILKNYEPKNLTLTNNRSIKTTDRLIEIVVPYDYISIREYNYCNINNYYYFIVDISSLNDCEQSSSVIRLEWDSWANNIDVINSNKDKIISSITSSHRDRYLYTGKPIYYPNTNYGEIETLENEMFTPDNTIQVLWAKITLNENYFNNFKLNSDSLYIKYNDDEDGTLYKFNDKSAQRDFEIGLDNGRRVIYSPIGFLRGGNFTDEITSISGEAIIFSSDYGTEYTLYSFPQFYPLIKSNGQHYEFISQYNEYIDSIEFTYHSPYKYTIDGGTINFNTLFLQYYFGDNVITVPFYPDRLFIQDTIAEQQISVIIKRTSSLDVFDFDKTIEINYDTSVAKRYIEKNDVNGVYQGEYEPKLDIYPFKFLELVIGNDRTILSPIRKSDEKYTIKIDNRTNQAKYSILSNTEIIKNCRNKFIDNSGIVSYSKRALDSYIIRNGSQKMTSEYIQAVINGATLGGDITSSVISIGSSIVKGSYSDLPNSISKPIKSLTNSIGQVAMLEALNKDLKKTPSTYNQSSFSEDDLYYQDRVIIIKHSISDIESYNMMMWKCYLYGYDNMYIGKPLTNSRYWFDYVQCDGCNISIPINNYDKSVIESVLNNGVFKYHIRTNQSGDYIFDKNMLKDMSLNNIETSIINLP